MSVAGRNSGPAGVRKGKVEGRSGAYQPCLQARGHLCPGAPAPFFSELATPGAVARSSRPGRIGVAPRERAIAPGLTSVLGRAEDDASGRAAPDPPPACVRPTIRATRAPRPQLPQPQQPARLAAGRQNRTLRSRRTDPARSRPSSRHALPINRGWYGPAIAPRPPRRGAPERRPLPYRHWRRTTGGSIVLRGLGSSNDLAAGLMAIPDHIGIEAASTR